MTVAHTHPQYSLTPYLHSQSVQNALDKFRPVPHELSSTFSRLIGVTQVFYSELHEGYSELKNTVEGDADDPRSAQNSFVIFSALSHMVLTSLDEVNEIVRFINTELELNSKPRPVSDDPATAEKLIARSRAEIEQTLQPTSELVRDMERLFQKSFSAGNYSTPYVLADAVFMEPLILKLVPHLLEAYRTKIHRQFLKNLATSRTRTYVEALSSAHELQNVPLLMRHGWSNFQEQLPANIKAAIRQAGV